MYETIKKVIQDIERLLNDYPRFKFIVRLIVYYYISSWITVTIVMPVVKGFIPFFTDSLVNFGYSPFGPEKCVTMFGFRSSKPEQDCFKEYSVLWLGIFENMTNASQIFFSFVMLVIFLIISNK